MSNTHVESGMRMPLAASALLGTLAENWWLLLLRGLVPSPLVWSPSSGRASRWWRSLICGEPTRIIDGAIAIWAAFNASGGDAGPRWWLGLTGVVSILAGIVAFVYTGMTALVLLMFIAVWAIIIGALQLYAAVQLRKMIENEWLLVLSGLLSIAFGALLIAWPSTGALAVIWTIAWYAVFFGCLLIGLAFRLKTYKRT